MKKYIILAAVCWFAVISLVGVILTVYDKRIAGSGKRRVPEAALMAVGLLGAAGPMYLTMKRQTASMTTNAEPLISRKA